MATATPITATATVTAAVTEHAWPCVFRAVSSRPLPLRRRFRFSSIRYLPFTDLPEHVAAIATLARLLPGGGGAPAYAISWSSSQYLLYDLIGAVLTRIIGDAVLANRLLLAAVAIAWPYAARSLLRALDRDERVAILAPATFWVIARSRSEFLPFVASVPVALFSLAARLAS